MDYYKLTLWNLTEKQAKAIAEGIKNRENKASDITVQIKKQSYGKFIGGD